MIFVKFQTFFDGYYGAQVSDVYINTEKVVAVRLKQACHPELKKPVCEILCSLCETDETFSVLGSEAEVISRLMNPEGMGEAL